MALAKYGTVAVPGGENPDAAWFELVWVARLVP
jgi:hypothetical protein